MSDGSKEDRHSATAPADDSDEVDAELKEIQTTLEEYKKLTTQRI